MNLIFYSEEEFERDIEALSLLIDPGKYSNIYPVPRGGVYVAIALSQRLNLPISSTLSQNTLVVDDLVDSGKTRNQYKNNDFACLLIKEHTPLLPTYYISKKKGWVRFWWEELSNELPAEDAVTRLIESIGEDPTREGLVETPKRFIKAWDFMLSGYKQNPEDILTVFNSDGYNQIILLKDIEMYSMCEHHIIPFIGKAHVAYIPDKKIIGISKLARLVEIYARRLQIQERIGDQVTSALMEYLKPQGAACIIEAYHLCMRMRGVQKQNSVMVTSSLTGCFLEDGNQAKQELIALIKD